MSLTAVVLHPCGSACLCLCDGCSCDGVRQHPKAVAGVLPCLQGEQLLWQQVWRPLRQEGRASAASSGREDLPCVGTAAQGPGVLCQTLNAFSQCCL